MDKFVAGHEINQGRYRAFIPSPINRRWKITDERVQQLLSQADQQIGRLDMYSRYVELDHYLNIHIAKEATQSSRIEGTRTDIRETFLGAAEIAPERRLDWEEVQNYIRAIHEAVTALERLPYSSRLFRQAHRVLMQGVRGQNKQPGDYRSSQNWIGGASIQDATHVPPPHSEIGRLMSDLEQFANDEINPLPDLLKIAIIHYQFETIHPFLDGNGRVGRLMITLYLVDKGILKSPILYLSDFFERNRRLYYDGLNGARHGDLTAWLKFFLTGVIQTADAGIATFDRILQLNRSLPKRLAGLGSRFDYAMLLMEALFRKPVVRSEEVSAIVGRSLPTVNRLLRDLIDLSVIREIPGDGRHKLYAFQEYLDLFE